MKTYFVFLELLMLVCKENLVKSFTKLKFKTEDYLITERCVCHNCKADAGKVKLIQLPYFIIK